MCRDHHRRQEWAAGGDGGGDLRPDLPSHRDDGPAEHPSGSCAGGAGPPQSQDRESEAVSCCRSQHLTDQKERSCFYEL